MSAEEHEEIPWSMLVDHERNTRSRFWYGAAAVVLAAVVGISGMRWFESRRHGEAPAAMPVPMATTTSPTTTLATEAGLVAADPGVDATAAIATAEWFVTDYFTLDGAPSPELTALFTTDAVLPELVGQTTGAPITFVEWARAARTRPYPGGLVVTVLFRSLYESPEGSIRRGNVRAVDVIVLVDGDATAVAELPMPADVPGHGIAGWMHTDGVAPPGAEADSSDRASLLGDDPLVSASGAAGSDWRVVITIADPSGARFPVAVRSGNDR